MATKKKGGPVTPAGKTIASKNALKHGATTKRFLSAEEESLFESFATALGEHYASNNPLVEMQIERISRIRVQLTRIQDSIDAAFQISRTKATTFDSLSEAMNLHDDQLFLAARSQTAIGSPSELLNNIRTAIAVELGDPTKPRPKTPDDFLESYPLFCRYLYERAQRERISVQHYIANQLSKPTDLSDEVLLTVMSRALSTSEKAIYPTGKDFVDDILDTDFRVLMKARRILLKEFARTALTKQTILDFNRLLPIHERTLLPDTEVLDKLMRYQTTLQRQLSTAIGELLALTSKRGPA